MNDFQIQFRPLWIRNSDPNKKEPNHILTSVHMNAGKLTQFNTSCDRFFYGNDAVEIVSDEFHNTDNECKKCKPEPDAK